MPLLVTTFISGMQSIVDNPPPGEPEAIVEHAAAFRAYMETLTMPPITIGHESGESAFIAVAQGQALPPPIGAAAITAAYVAYVTAMILDPGAATLVPVIPVGPPPVVPGTLEVYCAGIDVWAKSGTYTPPGATPIPWT